MSILVQRLNRPLLRAGFFIAFLVATSSPAHSEELKPICPDRGAIQTCTVDKGHWQYETSLVDWSHNDISTLLIADSVVRWGLEDNTEVQIAWSHWVRSGNQTNHSDVKLSLRHNILDSQLGLAVQTFIVLPVGSENVTQNHLGVGAALALSFDFNSQTQLYANPTIVVLPTAIISGALGINQTIHGPIAGTVEISGLHGAGQTQASLNFTAVWTASDNVELDIKANFGLIADSPDLQLILGVTRRF